MLNNIPQFLNDLLIKEYGEELTKKIIKGYKANRQTTFRVNTLKSSIDEVRKQLDLLKIKYLNVSWNNSALILEDDYKIQDLDIYKEGKIYVQSLSSMIPALVLDPKERENILDMCAAPGGKTTQMCAISENKAMITACEKNKIRGERLKYNLEMQGATKVTVMSKDARNLDNFFSFDKILLDAPCSGSGTLNLDNPNLNNEFTQELVNRSIKTQIGLLKKASMIVKSGGEIIYSTCSILKEENEKILEKVLENGNLEIVDIDKSKYKEVPLLKTTIDGVLCIMPNDDYEGFFVAKLRKKC